jgi:hypothetical protein
MLQMPHKIILDFGTFNLTAELFDLPVCDALVKILPATVELAAWGGELYGTLPLSCDEKGKLVPTIPPGGIAYSYQGSYLCIFFGQKPAWPVEHIGNIEGNEWGKLKNWEFDKVIIKKL